jgi:hypothetical protein
MRNAGKDVLVLGPDIVVESVEGDAHPPIALVKEWVV